MKESFKTDNLQAFDRLAALLADLFILFPIILLITSGIREKLNEFVTVGLSEELIVGKLIILAVGVGLLSFYRAVFQLFFNMSIGQKLLNISIKSEVLEMNKALHFIRLFLWSFIGTLFPFCILNISIFYNESSESIFDSFFGLKVESSRETKRYQTVFSKKFLRNTVEVGAFFQVIGFLIVVAILAFSFQNKEIDFSNLNQSSLSYPTCEEINEYHSNWREDGITESRIETAIALYGIGKISDRCLETEASLALRANSRDELGYLGAYLSSNEQNTFLKDLYLERVCIEASDSDACSLSKAISVGSEIQESPFLISKIWSVKRDLVNGKFRSAKKRLYNLPHSFGFDLFITQMRVKLKSLLTSDDYSNVDIGIALSAMDNINQLEFSRWICYEDLKGKCGKELTSACTHFVKKAEGSDSKLVIEDSYLLGKIKACNKDYTSLSKKGLSDTVNKYAGNQKSLEEIIFSSRAPEFIKLDAIHRLVEVTDDKEDVKGLAGEWVRQTERDFRWRKLGELLAFKLQKIEEKNLASEVFYSLVKEYGKSEFFPEGLDVPKSALMRVPASKKGN